MQSTPSHWSSIQEAGTLAGLKFLYGVYRFLGRRVVSFCLLPTVLYFVLLRAYPRKSSQQFLQQHYRKYPSYWKKPPNLASTCRHFFVFAETVADKLLSWFIEIDVDQFVIQHPERIERLMNDTRGQLIIGSHMGNLEYCRGFIQRYRDKTINILVHDKHSENYNAIMHQINPDSRLNVFQVSDFDVQTMLILKSKIDAGEWVFIAGDRIPVSGNTHTVDVEFIGKKAPFPVGPYLLAKGLGCPVKLMFSYCDYQNQQKPVYFEVVEFADFIELPRASRQQALIDYAQRYAQHLESHCENNPYQWFNFYDFWSPTQVAQ